MALQNVPFWTMGLKSNIRNPYLSVLIALWISVCVRIPIWIPDRIPVYTVDSLKSDTTSYLFLSPTQSPGQIHLQILLSLFLAWPNWATEAMVESSVPLVMSVFSGKTYPTCQANPSPPRSLWTPGKFTSGSRPTCQDWVVQGKGPYLAEEPYWS